MKRVTVLFIPLILFCCLSTSGLTAFADTGLTKIAGNVYSYVDVKNSSPQNSFGANAGIVIGRDGILVIDTLVSAREAKRFIDDIRAISDKPIRYVVNTHYHLDHSFGNAEFAKLGAIVVAHANDRQTMLRIGEAALQGAREFGLSEADLAGTALAYPVVAFTDRMEIDLGDQIVELIHPGRSHTDGSIVVFLSDQKVLFAGDALFTGYHPFLAEGNLPDWLKAIDAIAALDADVIIPGHGPLSTGKDLADMQEYLVSFDAMATALSAESSDPEYVFAEMRKGLPARPEGESLIRANIMMKYLAGKEGNK
ncbi:MAG TPA: MBL fold metallo-hydrolase [Desulfobulbaceae bacterium]|jgi:glyoxylase-like metal-dependent hydrolase (beta-lactamase superfamily II)|nr:MBL fold metallo-hydrolase [Desulfobulbaceae bacterium]